MTENNPPMRKIIDLEGKDEIAGEIGDWLSEQGFHIEKQGSVIMSDAPPTETKNRITNFFGHGTEGVEFTEDKILVGCPDVRANPPEENPGYRFPPQHTAVEQAMAGQVACKLGECDDQAIRGGLSGGHRMDKNPARRRVIMVTGDRTKIDKIVDRVYDSSEHYEKDDYQILYISPAKRGVWKIRIDPRDYERMYKALDKAGFVLKKNPPMCENAYQYKSGAGVGVKPQCHDNEAVNEATIWYNEVSNDTMKLCAKCTAGLKKEARKHKYKVTTKKLNPSHEHTLKFIGICNPKGSTENKNLFECVDCHKRFIKTDVVKNPQPLAPPIKNSAFIVSDGTINSILNAFVAQRTAVYNLKPVPGSRPYDFKGLIPPDFPDDMQKLGQKLLEINTYAVNQRYDATEKAPKFKFKPKKTWTVKDDVQAVKSMDCWDYNSSEGDAETKYDTYFELIQKLKQKVMSEYLDREPKWNEMYENAEWDVQ